MTFHPHPPPSPPSLPLHLAPFKYLHRFSTVIFYWLGNRAGDQGRRVGGGRRRRRRYRGGAGCKSADSFSGTISRFISIFPFSLLHFYDLINLIPRPSFQLLHFSIHFDFLFCLNCRCYVEIVAGCNKSFMQTTLRLHFTSDFSL